MLIIGLYKRNILVSLRPNLNHMKRIDELRNCAAVKDGFSAITGKISILKGSPGADRDGGAEGRRGQRRRIRCRYGEFQKYSPAPPQSDRNSPAWSSRGSRRPSRPQHRPIGKDLAVRARSMQYATRTVPPTGQLRNT